MVGREEKTQSYSYIYFFSFQSLFLCLYSTLVWWHHHLYDYLRKIQKSLLSTLFLYVYSVSYQV